MGVSAWDENVTIVKWITSNATHILKGLEHLEFLWWDYGAFTLMLVFSVLIGIYFGCFRNKERTASDYIFGGKNMRIFPVAFSLLASKLSGTTFIGIPAEIYFYGTQNISSVMVVPCLYLIMAYIYLPVIYKLQLRSTYQYLELRFGTGARLLASFLCTFNLIMALPIVIYAPSLAFNQVSGVKLYYVIPTISFICIFYTIVGGFKGVIWADTLQQVIITGSLIVIIFLGFQTMGSPQAIWEINEKGSRLEFFNMNPNPLERNTFWNVFIGFTFYWLAIDLNQIMVQRYLAVSSLRKSRIVMLIGLLGVALCKFLVCLIGMLLFAKYHDCDPLISKRINRLDQLFPFFVMDVGRSISGFPGIFLAGLFSAALSTMSSYLNTISGTIFEDFISKMLPRKSAEERAGYWMKGIVLVVGIITIIMAFVVDKLGHVVQISISFTSITCGPVLGLFTLGMLFPWANYKGAMIGTLTSFTFSAWMIIGAQLAIAKGDLGFPKKPLNIDGCNWIPFNETSLDETTIYDSQNSIPSFENHTSVGTSWKSTTEASEGLFPLYMISFYLYTFVGSIVVIIVGLVVSFLTGAQDPATINPDLISPVLHRWILPSKDQRAFKGNRPYTKSDSTPVNNVAQSLLINNEQELKEFVK